MSFCRTYNQIIDIADVSDDSAEITEPVTLAEMKNYMRLEGFENDDSTTEFDFDSDNDLIEEMIMAARISAEAWCGISIVPHTWEVLLTNLSGDIELPNGPNAEVTEILDYNNSEIDEDCIKVIGSAYKRLQAPLQEKMTVTYTAGFTEVPKPIKIALMKQVCHLYEHRGDELQDMGLCPGAINLLAKYKRADTWLA